MFPSHASLLIFVGAAALLLAIPGPAIFYIVGRSIGHSRNAGLVSALGIGVGTLIHTAAAAVGLSALLVSSASAFSVVKYLGAAYLIYLGVQKLRSDESFNASPDAPRTTSPASSRKVSSSTYSIPRPPSSSSPSCPNLLTHPADTSPHKSSPSAFSSLVWERSATASGPISPAR